MSELPAEQGGRDPEKYLPTPEPYWQTSSFWLAVLALVAIVALFFGGMGASTWREWIEYMTTHILAVLTFVFLIANTINTVKQRQITSNQEVEATRTRLLVGDQYQAMLDALKRTDSLLKQNERMIAEVEKQANASQDAVGKMQRALEQTDRSMQNDQSAYVMLKEVNSGAFMLGEPVHGRVVVINSGKTPAYDVRIYANLTFEPVPFSFTHEEAKKMVGNEHHTAYPSICEPNGGDMTQDVVWDGVLNDKGLEMEAKGALYFWGLITYIDIFSRDRWTEFCYRKHLKGQRSGVEPYLALNETNNNADRPEQTKSDD